MTNDEEVKLHDEVNGYLDEFLRATSPFKQIQHDDTELYLDELLNASDTIEHVGKDHIESESGRGSGRYAWGSGERLHQHDWDFMNRYKKLKAFGTINPDTGKPYTESEIAAQMGFFQYNADGSIKTDANGNKLGSTNKLRAEYQMANNNVRKDKYEMVAWYDDQINPETGKHYTDTQIANLCGFPSESSVRSYRKTADAGKVTKVQDVANKLKEQSEKLGYIDIGEGVELTLGISSDGLKTAVEMLKKEGYTVQTPRLNQVSDPNRQTTFKVLCPPGTPEDDNVWKHMQDIKRISDPDDPDNDIQSFGISKGLGDPPKVALDRIAIKYDEDGGTQRDGMIQIRAKRDENGNLVAACPDLSLGNAKYAQIRIAVEGNRYIKGMAVYDENLTGADILVNSNKSRAQGIDKALKQMEVNNNGELTSNPFGATVIPTIQRDSNGKAILDKDGNQIRSAINIVGATPDDAHTEGRWGNFSKNLPAQFLSKQGLGLIKQQLKVQSQIKETEYEDILKVNNPLVRKNLLIDYADQCDTAASNLKAAPISGQKYHVLLPVTTLKNTEVYAPNFENGTTVALVRFPHAGPFETPICTVNNNNKEARSFMKNAKDAVGINQHVASILSGADFDGDTAIVIPLTKKSSNGEFVSVTKIKGAKDVPKLPSLEGFDPTAAYGVGNPRFSSMQKVGEDGKMHPTYKYFKTDKAKGTEMGKITNLITDMYAKGCSDPDELSRAVRYSMVVIDAKKHELNWQAAKKDLEIQDLVNKYQGKSGVSSLVSRAGAKIDVEARQEWSAERKGSINPETGEKVYSYSENNTKQHPYVEKVTAPKGYTWTDTDGKVHKNSKYMKNADGTDVEATWDGSIKQNKDGTYYYDKGSGKTKWLRETVQKTQKVTRMSEVDDARKLLSSNPSEVEIAYATYANHMKALANQARKEYLNTPSQTYSPSAKKTYAKEVAELDAALVTAKKNAPRERQAQLLATSRYNAAVAENPDYYEDSDHKKKLRSQCTNSARNDTGAGKQRIKLTAKQWEAINAGAVSESKLSAILRNADKSTYMSLAMPKTNKISSAKAARARALWRNGNGYSQEEIASMLGISASSVSSIVS